MEHTLHVSYVLCIQHFEVDFLKFSGITKHISTVFIRLYFYARNLCRYFYDCSCVIIQPCDNTVVSVCININDFFRFWLYFIGKNNLGSTWYFIVETASANKRKRHLFRPQIQIPGQLALRYAIIRNYYSALTCLITVPSNSGSYRFLITPLHNLPGRVIDHHILVGPVRKLQPVPMKGNSISFRAFARLFSA